MKWLLALAMVLFSVGCSGTFPVAWHPTNSYEQVHHDFHACQSGSQPTVEDLALIGSLGPYTRMLKSLFQSDSELEECMRLRGYEIIGNEEAKKRGGNFYSMVTK